LSRLLVPRAKLAALERALLDAAAAWTVGDPMSADTRLGPVSSRIQQRRVFDYIDSGNQQGGRLLLGGSQPPAHLYQGAYVSPTIFSDVTPDMTIAREEIFGPVLAIMPYDNEDHAVAVANRSDFGLSGGVWSRDLDHAKSVARRLRTGHVAINGKMLNLEAPFGGRKRSGLGRELGRYGLEEYFNLQSLQGAV
jgi:acyl-CoA reductase-like NAD-dependent aldehyde dehydrogenase